LINIFTINRTWRLVDLPGHGFAVGAKKVRARFNEMVTEYLEQRPNLCCVFTLIDSGLTPQALDLEFVGWLARNSVPFVLVFTKTDKIPPAKVQANIAAFMARLAEWFSQPPAIFTCSSVTNQGRQELLGVIDEMLGAIPAKAEPSLEFRDEAPAPGRKSKTGQAAKKRPDRSRPW
jgi:GTP-binding protein